MTATTQQFTASALNLHAYPTRWDPGIILPTL